MAESVQCSVFLMRMVKLHTAVICGNMHVRLSTRFSLHAVKSTLFSCPSHTWSVVLVHSDSGGLQHSHFIHLVHSEGNPFPLFMRNLMRHMHNYYEFTLNIVSSLKVKFFFFTSEHFEKPKQISFIVTESKYLNTNTNFKDKLNE